MITEEQLAKDREPIPYIPVKQLRRDRPLYVMKQTRPHPIRGYGNSHDEFSVVDIRGYRKGYEPRLDILGQYTPNPHDLFRLGTGGLPPYQPTATGDKLQAEMERLQVHKAWRINPIARGNPMPPEEVPAVTEGLQSEYTNLIKQAENIAPDNPIVQQAREIINNITPENQRESLRQIEALEDELKGIVTPPAVGEVAPKSKVFYTTTTDMPHYDQLLDPTKAEYFAREKGEKGTVIWLTPDEALVKGAEIHGMSLEEELRVVSEEAISKYAEIMRQGEKFPMPVLDYKRGDQEGRHRILAAKKAGETNIPVLIVEEVAPKPPAVEEVKLGGGNPIPKELDLARTLAIIDSRPKGRIIESKLREEFGDAVIDALRQGRYVVSGSAGYNPPLLVSLKGRELIQGRNPEREEVPAVPEGLVDVSQLKALDLPNVRLTGSYATGRAKVASDVDILIGLTDEEWTKVTPRTPPPVIERIYSVLPEEKVSPMLYRLSDVKDMWFFKRGRMGVSGAFVPINDAEMVQGLWNSSIGLKEIPSVVENPKPPTPVTPEVTYNALQQLSSKYDIHLTGSYALGKAKPTGDIDVIVSVSDEIFTEPMSATMKEIEEDIWKQVPQADVFFSKADKSEVIVIPAFTRGGEVNAKQIWKGAKRISEVAIPKAPVPPEVTRAFTDIDVYGLVDKHLGDQGHIEYTATIIGGEKSFNKIAEAMASNKAFQIELKQTLKDIGLPEQITVYRGGKEGRISGEYTNVTLNPDVAERFGIVKTYQANLDDVIGIGKVNESELLFKTRTLKEIPKPPAAKSEVKLGGGNPIPKELDLARTLAIIDSRPKGRIIESKLREEFGDAVIDALRQGRYVVSGSAGYNPPLLVSLKGRELIQGGNPEVVLNRDRRLSRVSYNDAYQAWDVGIFIKEPRYGGGFKYGSRVLRRSFDTKDRAQAWVDEFMSLEYGEVPKEATGGNPMGKVITKEEAIGLLERLSMTPGEAARSLVADEAERMEIMQTVQQRVKREQNKWAPMDPREGPPLPRIFAGLRWPWKK